MKIKGTISLQSYAEIFKFWKEYGIVGGSVSIYGALPFRPGDWHYAISKMEFNAEKSCLSLWIDAYGEDSLLQIWGPQEITLSESEFIIRDAEKVVWNGTEEAVVNSEAAFKIY